MKLIELKNYQNKYLDKKIDLIIPEAGIYNLTSSSYDLLESVISTILLDYNDYSGTYIFDKQEVKSLNDAEKNEIYTKKMSLINYQILEDRSNLYMKVNDILRLYNLKNDCFQKLLNDLNIDELLTHRIKDLNIVEKVNLYILISILKGGKLVIIDLPINSLDINFLLNASNYILIVMNNIDIKNEFIQVIDLEKNCELSHKNKLISIDSSLNKNKTIKVSTNCLISFLFVLCSIIFFTSLSLNINTYAFNYKDLYKNYAKNNVDSYFYLRNKNNYISNLDIDKLNDIYKTNIIKIIEINHDSEIKLANFTINKENDLSISNFTYIDNLKLLPDKLTLLLGNLPSKDNQIALTDYQISYFEKNGFKDVDTNIFYNNITDLNFFIGKHLYINKTSLEITGIINTNYKNNLVYKDYYNLGYVSKNIFNKFVSYANDSIIDDNFNFDIPNAISTYDEKQSYKYAFYANNNLMEKQIIYPISYYISILEKSNNNPGKFDITIPKEFIYGEQKDKIVHTDINFFNQIPNYAIDYVTNSNYQSYYDDNNFPKEEFVDKYFNGKTPEVISENDKKQIFKLYVEDCFYASNIKLNLGSLLDIKINRQVYDQANKQLQYYYLNLPFFKNNNIKINNVTLNIVGLHFKNDLVGDEKTCRYLSSNIGKYFGYGLVKIDKNINYLIDKLPDNYTIGNNEATANISKLSYEIYTIYGKSMIIYIVFLSLTVLNILVYVFYTFYKNTKEYYFSILGLSLKYRRKILFIHSLIINIVMFILNFISFAIVSSIINNKLGFNQININYVVALINIGLILFGLILMMVNVLLIKKNKK